jgi:hypothetical protein
LSTDTAGNITAEEVNCSSNISLAAISACDSGVATAWAALTTATCDGYCSAGIIDIIITSSDRD